MIVLTDPPRTSSLISLVWFVWLLNNLFMIAASVSTANGESYYTSRADVVSCIKLDLASSPAGLSGEAFPLQGEGVGCNRLCLIQAIA